MALRLIMYDAIPLIPLFLGRPPHHAPETTFLWLKFDEPEGTNVLAAGHRNHAAALYGTFLVEGEAAEDFYDNGQEVVTRYEKETKGQEVSERYDEGALAELGETTKFHWDVSRFRGHATRDWGYWFRVLERGLKKHIETMMG